MRNHASHLPPTRSFILQLLLVAQQQGWAVVAKLSQAFPVQVKVGSTQDISSMDSCIQLCSAVQLEK